MKETLSRALARHQRSFAAFTTGQKVVAVVGTAALVLAGVLVFRWAATPSYAPLYSNLSAEDASAVVERLEADSVPYEITGNGGTIMVPRDQVYETRISLSGDGLPSSSGEGGYSILDSHDLSTSQFKEQTDFKRAMEGELATTIEALDDVETAIVHLALPTKQVFADEQDPATASVLIATRPGSQLEPEQVQAVVHTVASSIDGLDPAKVTVADSTGRVLSSDGGDGAASTRAQQVEDFQQEMNTRIQTMLDRVVGPGNSTVQVTADLDFDKAVTESTTYTANEENPPLSSSTDRETYNGPAGAGAGLGAGGVVGPDGQMEPGVTGETGSSYEKSSTTEDNAVDRLVEHRETAPGSVNSLHTAVVVDTNAPIKIDPVEVEDLVAAAIGIDRRRGDTVQVSALPFDRTAEEAAAAQLAKAAAADAAAARMEQIKKAGLVGLVALALFVVWLKGRRRSKAREEATTYVVEQLRQDQASRLAAAQAAIAVSPATMALERADRELADDTRDELAALVERQPEEVAMLLRGWLVERH